jgi:hypothetical protein
VTRPPHYSPPFAPGSFWNTPLDEAAPDSRSQPWIALLKECQPGIGLHINLHTWTIPVFTAGPETPRHHVHPKLLRCPLSQGHVKTVESRLDASHPLGLHESIRAGIPLPDAATPDGEQDAHLSIVDPVARRAYDLWQCRRESDGTWHTNAAIAYDLDGTGVFTREDIPLIRPDESVHFYGPCRASGVPAIAGLIMEEEIRQGRIAHKLAFACPVPGLQRYVAPPAAWTDGWHPEGLPEGCTLRLDPRLDLTAFSLSPAETIVARALQEYGAVLVDYAGGVTLYGELLEPHPGRSWNGVLEENSLAGIPFDHFHVVETGPLQTGGSHPVYHQGISRRYYDYIEKNGTAGLDALEPWRKALA